MAQTLSAGPREKCAPTDLVVAIQPLPAALAAWREGHGLLRLLQAAALVHVSALALALLTSVELPATALLIGASFTALLALALPRTSEPSAVAADTDSLCSVSSHDLSPKVEGSGASPSPLPFIGERIVPGPEETAQLAGLARAAQRLRRVSPVRRQIWADLTARVSHELRTPLNAVIGFSDVLEAELLGPVGHPRYREYARHIRDSSRELLKSAEDTLAITCLLDHDPEARADARIDFKAAVEEAWAFHTEPPSLHGLTLEAQVPDGLEVLIEQRPLKQILINLFAEAVRRSDARGTVGLVATVDGDLVQIEVFLRGRPDRTSVGQASLPVSLAHALLELQGATLIEVDDPHATWRAVTVLECAAQNDFFATPAYQEVETPAQQVC